MKNKRTLLSLFFTLIIFFQQAFGIEQAAFRKMLAYELSQMYSKEIPEYKQFTEIVKASNIAFLDKNESLNAHNKERVLEEKHGAIRVSTPEEMRLFSRIFKLMGMHPVEFYDLTPLGIPMIATAFRPIDASIEQSAFRMFTSMLHPDYIPEEVKPEVEKILNQRKNNPKFSKKLLNLLTTAEQRELNNKEAKTFIKELVAVFKLESSKPIYFPLYKSLREKNDVYADNICVGINLNHLTPRAFDILDAQKRLVDAGVPMKDGGIEGPVIRQNAENIQLNQTSRKAPGELITVTSSPDILNLYHDNKKQYDFLKNTAPILRMEKNQSVNDYLALINETLKTHKLVLIEHKARFGEIESRHVALTQPGETLYQKLKSENKFEHDFPKTHEQMFEQNLAYYTVEVNPNKKLDHKLVNTDLNFLVKNQYVTLVPQTYEDFLAVSAAGIFKSNLSNGVQNLQHKTKQSSDDNHLLLEKAMGTKILSRHDLALAEQTRSQKEAYKILGL